MGGRRRSRCSGGDAAPLHGFDAPAHGQHEYEFVVSAGALRRNPKKTFLESKSNEFCIIDLMRRDAALNRIEISFLFVLTKKLLETINN